METYITRQPIMNREHKVVAYELLYQQDSSLLYNQRDQHVAIAMAEVFNNLGQSNFLDDKDAFLTFTPNLLRQDIPSIFEKNKLVMQIEENVLIHPESRKILEDYREKGYRLAVVGFEVNTRYLEILPKTSFMKLDFKLKSERDLQKDIDFCKRYSIQTIAFNVNDKAMQEKALEMGVDFFQGTSVAEMVRTKTHRMDHLQSNFFRLMGEITKEQPDMDEVANIISVDVTLAFSLMKLVNSSYFALRNPVKEVKQALMILGLESLKQWIYLLSFSPDDGMQDEVIKTAFQRAILCQKLITTTSVLKNLSKSDAYILGMFSTLDILLEVSIEDAVEQLPLSDEIKEALVQHTGIYGDLLELCFAYEKGEWGKMTKKAEALQIPVNTIARRYFEAVESSNETWNELQQSDRG